MLRITCGARADETRQVKVEGRIAGEYVAELSRAMTHALEGARRVVLDMSDVTFIDQPGVMLLRRLRQRGVELAQCSTFVDTLLKGAAQ